MTLKAMTENNLMESNSSLVNQTLKVLGQIMLQENAFTGLLFLVGIFYGSFTMGAAAIIATLCGTVTASLLKVDKTEINKGLYGFNAALVGVAVVLFLKPGFISWILIIIGSVLTTLVQHLFIKRKIVVFTLPFVLVTWLILFAAKHYFPAILSEAAVSITSTSNNFTFAIKGFGQVIFQDTVISGMLFFIAVFISSPIAALYGLAGAILSAILSRQFSTPIEDISIGLFSYNAVLCAIVFAGTQLKDGIWVLISVILSLAISLLMLKFNITQLTFPFVLASCTTLLLKNKITW